MTKKDWIARYGIEHYEEHKRKNRIVTLKRYHEHPELRPPQSVVNERKRKCLAKPEKRAKYQAYNRAYMKAKWAKMSPEERKAVGQKRWLAVKAKRAADPAYDAEWREAYLARHLVWRDANRDKVNFFAKRWQQANRERFKSIAVANAARRRAGGKIDADLVEWIRSQPCVDCGATERIEVGHRLAVADGGTNDPENLIPQCRSCNRRLWRKPHKSVEPN